MPIKLANKNNINVSNIPLSNPGNEGGAQAQGYLGISQVASKISKDLINFQYQENSFQRAEIAHNRDMENIKNSIQKQADDLWKQRLHLKWATEVEKQTEKPNINNFISFQERMLADIDTSDFAINNPQAAQLFREQTKLDTNKDVKKIGILNTEQLIDQKLNVIQGSMIGMDSDQIARQRIALMQSIDSIEYMPANQKERLKLKSTSMISKHEVQNDVNRGNENGRNMGAVAALDKIRKLDDNGHPLFYPNLENRQEIEGQLMVQARAAKEVNITKLANTLIGSMRPGTTPWNFEQEMKKNPEYQHVDEQSKRIIQKKKQEDFDLFQKDPAGYIADNYGITNPADNIAMQQAEGITDIKIASKIQVDQINTELAKLSSLPNGPELMVSFLSGDEVLRKFTPAYASMIVSQLNTVSKLDSIGAGMVLEGKKASGLELMKNNREVKRDNNGKIFGPGLQSWKETKSIADLNNNPVMQYYIRKGDKDSYDTLQEAIKVRVVGGNIPVKQAVDEIIGNLGTITDQNWFKGNGKYNIIYDKTKIPDASVITDTLGDLTKNISKYNKEFRDYDGNVYDEKTVQKLGVWQNYGKNMYYLSVPGMIGNIEPKVYIQTTPDGKQFLVPAVK